MSLKRQPVRVAVLGCGTVGSETIRLLRDSAKDLEARIGAPIELIGVAVKDKTAPLPIDGLDPAILTEDPVALAEQADVVVELMGGIEPARTAILAALEAGAGVVTANKALLAVHGPELYAAAQKNGVDLYFEAAVGGAIPILRPIRESLAGDTVRRILGIVNGTTNYVLDRMTLEGLDFEEVLADAQRLGYAEADPTADVDGFDAASKAAILASLAFHTRVSLDDVYREGIRDITADDVAAAAATGHVIKLLAIVERRGPGDQGTPDSGVIARVHPALVPLDHPLASVHGAFNAIYVESEAAGELMFYGRGAGGRPTASAVVGDLVTVARHGLEGTTGPGESTYLALPTLDVAKALTRFQIRLVVKDQPGVLAGVAQVFAAEGVSIETVRQTPGGPALGNGHANLTVVTHQATEGALQRVVAALAGLDVVERVAGAIRVEGE
ncbi:MAG: homoserine dehydrogenase [Bifidobacteriaceae bacterium]|nr:homoserine dehydrogenase [Bifidobacteriaceae bacterium]